jgi:hypothetical protein
MTNWILLSDQPEHWINLDTVRGLKVAKDGTSKLWWAGNPAPVKLGAAETAHILAAVRGKTLTTAL